MTGPTGDYADRGAKARHDPAERPVWYEISDAIWLAGHMAAAGATGFGGTLGRSAGETTTDGLDVDGETAAWAGETTDERPDGPTAADGGGLGTAARSRSTVTAGRLNGLSWRTPHAVVPMDGNPFAGVRPLPDRRRIEQALRPLRKPTPTPRGEPELDDEATAIRAVQDGLWLPETRPAMERWLDLDVVVDDGPLAALTRPVADEFIDCLAKSGAFRTVHTHLLDTGTCEPGMPTLRRTGPLAVPHAAAGLVERGRRGRRLLVVLTDGIGSAWHCGAAQHLLAGWGRQVPLVIVNLLARRQWRRTGIATCPAKLFAAGRAVANHLYRMRRSAAAPDHDGALADTPMGRAERFTSHVFVPVIELDHRQLARWARFVAAPRGTWYGAVAECEVVTAERPEPRRRPDADGETVAAPGASELVRRFRAAVSPAVYALAVHLAAVPLNAPIMRLVQRTMLPDSRPADLTELVGSGLLRKVGGDRRLGTEAPDEVTLDFVPGVREELLARGRRSETTQVLLTVARHLGDRIAGLRDLVAMIIEPEHARPQKLNAQLMPFAIPTLHVLRALAGPYLRPARALESRLRESEPRDSGTRDSGTRESSAGDEPSPPPQSADHPSANDLVDSAVPSQEAGIEVGKNDSMQTLDSTTADEVNVAQDTVRTSPYGVGVTIRTIPQATGRKPSDPPPIWGNVPPQNINFTGREELLEQLHERLSHGTTAVLPQALHGMGGVGKSQIAIEYVYRHQSEYDLIWWVRSERPGQIQQDLTELAGSLDLPVSQEVNVAVPAVREALRLGRPYRNWLLIFDNAEELEEVQQFFPTNGPGKILVTSRNQAWTKVASSLEVDVFAREESKALLRLRGPDLSDAAADEVAELLGDLPLAIAQAAVWLAETGMPVDEYLHLFKEKHEKAAELLEDTSLAYELPVAAAWNVSLDRLRNSEPAALQLLQVCAFFAPEPISLRLLSGARNVDGPPELLEAIGDPIKLGRAIRAINQYALAKINHKDNTILLHRLVQRVLVSQIDPTDAALLRRCGHQLMANYDPDDPVLPANWQRYAALLPHILYSRVVESDDTWVRHLILNEIDFLFQWGDHRGFLELAETAVQTWTEKLGQAHAQTLAAEIHYGRALRLRGRFAEAYEHHNRVLEIQTEALGTNDERTLEAQQHVATDLRYQGKFRESLEYTTRGYETAQRMYGNEDPVTLWEAHLHAISLRLNGNFWAARDLDRETYRHLVTMYGETHARTLGSLAAVAVDEMECGDYDAARELTRLNVQRLETAFGSSWAGLAESMSAFSVMERKAGDHERALQLSTEALERYKARYGNFHPGTISAALNHAVSLRQVGRLEDSIRLARETAQDFLKMFGPDHPNTATANINLAVALRLNGQAEEARSLDEAALEVLTRGLGIDHPRAIICSINLASDNYTLGNYQAAVERDRDTLERARRVLGESHPTALAGELNHAMDLRAVGDEQEAETRIRHAIDSLRRVHGPKHPATISAQQGSRADCDIYPIPV